MFPGDIVEIQILRLKLMISQNSEEVNDVVFALSPLILRFYVKKVSIYVSAGDF